MGHSIIWTLVIGLLIGAVAKLLMPGRDPGGCILTILIGIAGAYVASYFGQKWGGDANKVSLLVSSLRWWARWCSCCFTV